MDTQMDVGIDWLTVTSPKESNILDLVGQVRKNIAAADYGKPFHWLGYVGESYVADGGHMAWGVKSGHGLVQMSGDWANRVFRNLDAFSLLDYKCTRLDLAVTVCLPAPAPLVDQIWTNPGFSQKECSAILKKNGEGGTLYIGCRVSDYFGRLYDKGAEIRSRLHKESIPNCRLWRYEVEYKRSKAKLMLTNLSENVRDHAKLDETIIAIVHGWFLYHGVDPAFKPGASYSNIVQVATRVTSTEKTLDWFRVQVRPALARVAEDVAVRDILWVLGVEADSPEIIRWRRDALNPIQLGLWEINPQNT